MQFLTPRMAGDLGCSGWPIEGGKELWRGCAAYFVFRFERPGFPGLRPRGFAEGLSWAIFLRSLRELSGLRRVYGATEATPASRALIQGEKRMQVLRLALAHFMCQRSLRMTG